MYLVCLGGLESSLAVRRSVFANFSVNSFSDAQVSEMKPGYSYTNVQYNEMQFHASYILDFVLYFKTGCTTFTNKLSWKAGFMKIDFKGINLGS